VDKSDLPVSIGLRPKKADLEPF